MTLRSSGPLLAAIALTGVFGCKGTSSSTADLAVQLDAGPTDAAAATDGASCPVTTTHALSTSTALAITGDPGGAPGGFGDPSISYPTSAASGYLTYTAVGASSAAIRIAISADHGTSWSHLGAVNAVTPLSITTTDPGTCGATTCAGSWVHETSSIVEDPTDPDPARRYKVFAHSYFISAGGNQRYEVGSIDLWTTASPMGGATWVETRLLGWSSPSPRSSTGVATVVTTDPTLSPLLGSCIALTEPGAIVRGGTIDLALGCIRYVSATEIPVEVVMIRSTDHGAGWKPVAKLLDVADAVGLGAAGAQGAQINGADLFTVGGTYYLFATPNGPVTNFGGATTGYRGCYAFPFADIETGQLARCGGKAVVAASIVGGAGLFHGACTYREGASAAGAMILTADVSRTPPFAITATGLSLP